MTLTPDLLSFAGRTVLVTGAAQGLGEAMARSFAAFGADLAICDRQTERLAAVAAELRAAGTKVDAEVLDVRDREAVQAWVARLATVDVLVNNAGGTFRSSVMAMSSKGQASIVDENFTSVTNFVRACVPKMAPGSSIVNVTTIEAFRAAPGYGVYAAMKAAVEQLTKTLSLELAHLGIRVATIAPDAIPTVGETSVVTTGGDGGPTPGGYGDRLPLGWGRPDDAAGAAIFLASPLARYVTGTTIHVDGGANAARGWRPAGDGEWGL